MSKQERKIRSVHNINLWNKIRCIHTNKAFDKNYFINEAHHIIKFNDIAR